MNKPCGTQTYLEISHYHVLTHWGRVTHICVNKLTGIGSDNGLSPDRRQVIIWTNAGILLIGTLETNLREIVIEIHPFSFKKMHLKMSSGKWRPFCLGLNVLIKEDTGTLLHWKPQMLWDFCIKNGPLIPIHRLSVPLAICGWLQLGCVMTL